ncbi:hypothetical protein [Streptomyces sp. NRRL F-5630]|uniref:hypothetical protein n=1 Tax=Streptomyces sp. NRRL F-5630 TaxID=1463864 RepID=UPI003D75EE03
MPYRYRCHDCRAEQPEAGDRAEAEAFRDRHRQWAHGGLAPDNEQIERVPAGGRDHDGRYVSSSAALLLLAVLAVVSLGARALGH